MFENYAARSTKSAGAKPSRVKSGRRAAASSRTARRASATSPAALPAPSGSPAQAALGIAAQPTIARCPWPTFDDPLYLAYHDEEWGVPVHDDRKLYEFIVLEVFQAGLSWRTVLHKRENFRRALAGFDFDRVARFGKREVARMMGDAGIIRNRAKIEAAIHNARCLLEVRQEFGTFSRYMWSWVDGRPILHQLRTLADYPTYTDEAVTWSKDLKRRGFKFLGPTVVYAHMQAVGMVNDHTEECFRYQQLAAPPQRAAPQ
jgi:DNA-3-methyladenine glycosylase I